MERRLLLLGLIRKKPMSGYRIGELLGHQMGNSVNLTVSTAYRILAGMCAEGLIKGKEEQDGKRPTKTVYSITPKGEESFQNLLRSCIASFGDVNYPSAVPLGFLDQLETEEALALLDRRMDQIRRISGYMKDHKSHHGSFALVLEHHHRHLILEEEWLGEIIGKLRKADC